MMSWLEAFGRRVRSPQEAPLPEGIPVERMAVYERLFLNTQSSLLEKGFPVLRQRLGPERWLTLMRMWLQTHYSQEPRFPHLGEEFIEWMARQQWPADWSEPPGLLAELAHFERVETSLFLHDDVDDWTGWSPLAWPLAYQWPVHRMHGSSPVAAGDPVLLLAYRSLADEVLFDSLSPSAWQLAMALQQGEALQAALARRVPESARDSVGLLLDRWRHLGVWRD